jgi:ATP adenylyltransferase
MEHLWAPWRSVYVATKGARDECIFCAAAFSDKDEETLVVHRAQRNFIILNRYPYTNGHLMIAPYQHASRLHQIDIETANEMTSLTRASEQVMDEVYRPQGINIGLNLGEAAGAGIEQHLHWHVLPRWIGDANFMTSVANTRVLSEDLSQTYAKLSAAFKALSV